MKKILDRFGAVSLAWLAAEVLVLNSAPAFACGGVFDVACNLQNGGLSPGNILTQTQKAGQDAANAATKATQDVANAVNELQASVLSGPTLEQAIIASHNTAINGAMPIPPEIRQRLTGYASEDSMDRVRYKIGDSGFANLAHLIEQGGVADAVTLIDVVVFRGPTEATNLSTWAHELTHVDQYRDWGVRNFAVSYTRNWHSVEEPAYAKGDGYWAWREQRNGSAATAPTSESVQFTSADGTMGMLTKFGQEWREFSNGVLVFRFIESRRDSNFVYLVDQSRNMELAIPIANGVSEWRYLTEQSWHIYLPMTRSPA